jgi:hypothetical protein
MVGEGFVFAPELDGKRGHPDRSLAWDSPHGGSRRYQLANN